MKALVFSDLHIPVNHSAPAIHVPDEVNVIIVAGDIAAPVRKAMDWLDVEVANQGVPVVFVAGNHEHYSKSFEESIDGGRFARKDFPNVHWLENSSAMIGGVRFLGATLWTDYELYERPDAAMKAAYLGLNDHRVIYSHLHGSRHGMFTPEQALALHRESRAWLEERLSEPFDGKTVVVTHHAPHPGSISPKYLGDALTPAFVSDLTDLIGRHQPDMWIHGHVHHSCDYVVPETKTRIVCNPRGYGYENPSFRMRLVVEV